MPLIDHACCCSFEPLPSLQQDCLSFPSLNVAIPPHHPPKSRLNTSFFLKSSLFPFSDPLNYPCDLALVITSVHDFPPLIRLQTSQGKPVLL